MRLRNTPSYAYGLESYPNQVRDRNPILEKYSAFPAGWTRPARAFRITTIIIESHLNPVVMRKSGRRDRRKNFYLSMGAI
jgi:hypothetical protein